MGEGMSYILPGSSPREYNFFGRTKWLCVDPFPSFGADLTPVWLHTACRSVGGSWLGAIVMLGLPAEGLFVRPQMELPLLPRS